MRLILIFPIIALVSIVIAFVGLEYFEKLELEQLIISCMKQYGHYSDEVISCVNKEI